MKNLSNENVIHIKKGEVEYLQFRKLLEYSDIINHAYTLGIDKSYRTMRANLKELPKEEMEKSINNFKNLSKAIEIDYTELVRPNQNHTKNVISINKKINSNLPDFNIKEYDNIDGLITNKSNIALVTTNADCILFLFFDPKKRVIANVHSGWKGTLGRISVNTIQKMKEEYNCNLQDIICCITPCIRKCHFEVKEDVKKLYCKEFKNIKNINELIIQTSDEKWNIDTVEINKIILQEAGLKKENIIDSGICSVCNSDLVHSYRVEKEGYGLAAAVIELK